MKGVKRPPPGEARHNGKRAKDEESSQAEESELEQEATPGDSQRQSRPGGGEEADNDDADVEAKNGTQDEDGKVGASAGGGGGGAADSSKRPKEQLDEIPLVVPAAVCKDTKASLLVHLRDETLDFSGDTGAVGRIAVGSKKKGSLLTFDLKGQQFGGQIIPSATVLVVGVGRAEAKVEGLFSEVCRLNYKGNVFDSMGGEVLKGEMDDSYKFEEEDVNARGGGGDGGAAGAEDGGGGSSRTPKAARKKSIGKKKGSSSSAKKGTKSASSSKK